MGISEEESIRRLINEKSSGGHMDKWLAIISALYFLLMLWYERSPGVLVLAAGIFIVSFSSYLRKRRKVKNYRMKLSELSSESSLS
ncbi:ABC transporter ATP-binding protein [Enterobacillus tribolii]|uniref:Uncharacterized protein n=1 Tax=Enterobacillus tribolii TaxID=1487935 RepID=A0A370QHZ2_9GAMM|nr:ABC transporter ATP-binding protein [Enterobacillus tribolii]MBW7982670.1 ABC transporter ATP-binding protein [Enterobacillus tribolii]RDK87949.1 hypothetical protein C8D90_108231 [Enterobacillus tribolii]